MQDLTKVRVVFKASTGSDSFFRFYVNVEETSDSTVLKSDFGFSKRGAKLAFLVLPRKKARRLAQFLIVIYRSHQAILGRHKY